LILANYNFASFLWDVLVIFAFVIWFWLLIMVFSDLFSRHDIGGWGKAAWIILVIILPYLGVFIYLIANGHGMAERGAARAQAQQAQMDDYVRSVASSDSGADQIAKGKQLLDSGAITQEEFDQLKARALSS
jgi:uncharacterized membrane protein YcjF (UPF0283 family)